MQVLPDSDPANVKVLVDRHELLELALPESIVSRMSIQNPGSYQSAWMMEEGDTGGMILVLPIDECQRMAAERRSLPIDHDLFAVINRELHRRASVEFNRGSAS